MILAEQCQADATKACCQKQPGQRTQRRCAQGPPNSRKQKARRGERRLKWSTLTLVGRCG